MNFVLICQLPLALGV